MHMLITSSHSLIRSHCLPFTACMGQCFSFECTYKQYPVPAINLIPNELGEYSEVKEFSYKQTDMLEPENLFFFFFNFLPFHVCMCGRSILTAFNVTIDNNDKIQLKHNASTRPMQKT